MKTKVPIQIRQGDVLLVRVDKVPAGAVGVKREQRGVVLAEGEATGHAHRVVSRHAKLYRTEEDQRYMVGTAGIQLGHEEHKTRCHVCPELPLVMATLYDATVIVPLDRERERYACDEHASDSAIRLEEPGKTYLPAGSYHRTLDADYVPGELPRDVAD